jgi:hypothetical protein
VTVDGTPYTITETPRGWVVQRPTTRRAVPDGAPVSLSVAGPYRTRGEALSVAVTRGRRPAGATA